MTEIPKRADEFSRATGEARDQQDAMPHDSVHADVERRRSGPPWKSIVLLVGAGFAIAAATSVVTLAATHNSAVAANARAYVNGLTDGLAANVRAYINGLVDGLDADGLGLSDDWPYE